MTTDKPWWDDSDSVLKWPRSLVCRRRPWENADYWECPTCSAERLKVLMPSTHPDFPNGVWTWVCPSCPYAPEPLPDPPVFEERLTGMLTSSRGPLPSFKYRRAVILDPDRPRRYRRRMCQSCSAVWSWDGDDDPNALHCQSRSLFHTCDCGETIYMGDGQ